MHHPIFNSLVLSDFYAAALNKLMKERNLDFTTAFTLVCEEENGLKTTPATATRSAAPTATVKKTGELMLVCAIEPSALEIIEAGWQ